MARIKNLIKFGWQHAGDISSSDKIKKTRVFCDIIMCYYRYHLLSNQYKKERFHLLDSQQRDVLGKEYRQKNDEHDRWQKEFLDNQRFLLKWSGLKYSLNGKLREERDQAYKKQFNFNHLCKISSGVIITKQHYSDAQILIGKDCRILDDVNIDFTGGITLGNSVAISEGVKILTHNHTLLGDTTGVEKKKMISTPLIIEDNAWIGTKVIVLPGVERIGRRSTISAGTVVRHRVPPYAVVMGNPSKIVGFSLTPYQVSELEQSLYPEEERTDIIKYTKEYNKFFIEKTDDINRFLKKTC